MSVNDSFLPRRRAKQR